VRKRVVVHLRCAISKIAPEGFGGTEFVLLGESEVNQHRDIIIREKNIRGSGEKVSIVPQNILSATTLT